MPRRKRTPEEIARKAKVRELMQELDINDMSDINTLFKEFVVDVLENGLEAELDDELYSKYDYRNKDTDNSRNGHSAKTMKTSFGEIDIDVPRDRKGEFEPQLVKKQQTSLGILRKKYYPCMPKVWQRGILMRISVKSMVWRYSTAPSVESPS